MDDAVKAALQRWPDVPAVYGWLSLDARGRWRLHPNGDAAAGEPGEPITNPQIIAFIDRNYASGPNGQWYFQNGPQRVYVKLPAAPHVLRLADTGDGLQSHTGQAVATVSRWFLAGAEALYASTDIGPGRIVDRDLAAVLERLRVSDGRTLLDVLEQEALDQARTLALADATPAPLVQISLARIPAALGFDPDPRP